MPHADRHDLSEVSSKAYPSLERVPGKQNWVDKAGGLPSYIERIAKHLHYEKGRPIGTAIATAVATTKRWCSTGKNWNGGDLKADTQAKACAAVASWEAKRGKSKAKSAAKDVKESLDLSEVKENRELIEAHCDDRVAAEIAALAKRRATVASGMLPILRETKTVGKAGLVEAAVELLRADLHEDTKLAMVGGPAADPREMKRVADALEREIEEVSALAESFGGDKEKGDGEQSDAPPWEKDAPKKGKKKKLTASQKRRARERAKRAGRKYPNLVDNMAVAGEMREAMMRGAEGDGVKKVQRQVYAMGASVGDAGADGKYGVNTESGVKAVQRREGLKADGIVGPKTQAMLDEKSPVDRASESAAPTRREVSVPSWESSGRKMGSRSKRPAAMMESDLREDAMSDAGDAEAATDGNMAAVLDGPPNLREGSGDMVCATCEYYEDGKCTAHGDHSVGAGQVCDDWESEMADVMESACHECHTDLEQGESLCPECGTTVLAEAKLAESLQEATVDNRLRGAARSAITSRWTPDMIAQIRRLPDGTFAPKGRGRVLKAGDRVRTPRGTRGRVSKDGRSITLANGEKVRLAPAEKQRQGAPEPRADAAIANETDREVGPRPSEFERSIGVMSPSAKPDFDMEDVGSPDADQVPVEFPEIDRGTAQRTEGVVSLADIPDGGEFLDARGRRYRKMGAGPVQGSAVIQDLPEPADDRVGPGFTDLWSQSIDTMVKPYQKPMGTASPEGPSANRVLFRHAQTLRDASNAIEVGVAQKDLEPIRKAVNDVVKAELPDISRGGQANVIAHKVSSDLARLKQRDVGNEVSFLTQTEADELVKYLRDASDEVATEVTKNLDSGTASPEGPSSGWPDALERLNDWIGLYEGPWDTEDVGRGNYAAIAPIAVSDTDRGGGWAYVYPDGQVEITDETGNQVAITASGHALDDTAVDPIGAGRKKPQDIESEAASVLSGNPPKAYQSGGTASVGQSPYEDDYRRPLRLAQLALDAVWDRGEEDGPMDRMGAAYQSALAEKALKGLSVPTDFRNSVEINDEIRNLRLDVGLVSGPEGVAQLSPDRAKELSQRIGRVVDRISDEIDRNPRYLGDAEYQANMRAIGAASVRFETVDDSNVPEFSEFVDKMNDDPGIVGQAVRSSEDSAVATDLKRAYAITAIDARRPARGGMRPRNFRSQDWFVGSVGGYLNLQGSLSGFGSRPTYPEQVTPTESIDTVIYREGPKFGIDPTEYLPQDALDRERKRLEDENEGGIPTVNGTASPDTDLVAPDSPLRNPARRDLMRIATLRSRARAGSASPGWTPESPRPEAREIHQFLIDAARDPEVAKRRDVEVIQSAEAARYGRKDVAAKPARVKIDGKYYTIDLDEYDDTEVYYGEMFEQARKDALNAAVAILQGRKPDTYGDYTSPAEFDSPSGNEPNANFSTYGYTEGGDGGITGEYTIYETDENGVRDPNTILGTGSPIQDVPEPSVEDMEAVYGPKSTWAYNPNAGPRGFTLRLDPNERGWDVGSVVMVNEPEEGGLPDKVRIVATGDGTVTVRTLYANGTQGEPYEVPEEAIETLAIPEGGYRATRVFQDWGDYSEYQVGPAYGIVNEAPGKPTYYQRAFVERIRAENLPGQPHQFVVGILTEHDGHDDFEQDGLYYGSLAEADKEARRLGWTDWSLDLDKWTAPRRLEGSASVSYEDTTAQELRKDDYILDESGIAQVSIVEQHAGWTEVWHDGITEDSASPWRLYEPDYPVTRVNGMDSLGDDFEEQLYDRVKNEGANPAEARRAILAAQVSPQLGGGTASPPPSYEDEIRRVSLPDVATGDRELPTVEELTDRWMNGDFGDDSYGTVDEVGHAARYGKDVLVTDTQGFTDVAHFDDEDAADEFASKYEVEPLFALGTASTPADWVEEDFREKFYNDPFGNEYSVKYPEIDKIAYDMLPESGWTDEQIAAATDAAFESFYYTQAFADKEQDFADRFGSSSVAPVVPGVRERESARIRRAKAHRLKQALAERSAYQRAVTAGTASPDTDNPWDDATIIDARPEALRGTERPTVAGTIAAQMAAQDTISTAPAGRTVTASWGPFSIGDSGVSFFQVFDGESGDLGPDRRYVKVTYQPGPDLYAVEITDVSASPRSPLTAPTVTLDGVYADGLNDALLATPFHYDRTTGGTASPGTNDPFDMSVPRLAEIRRDGELVPLDRMNQREIEAYIDPVVRHQMETTGEENYTAAVGQLMRERGIEWSGRGLAGPSPAKWEALADALTEDEIARDSVRDRGLGTASVAPGVREREAAATRRRRANRLRVALQERQTGVRIAALGTASPSIGDYARRAQDERDAKTAEKARKAVARGRVYRLEPVLMDRMGGTAEVQQAIEDGTPVVLVQPPGTPRNGTMGQVYVGDARTGRFLGMVSKNSLVKLSPEERKALRDEQGGTASPDYVPPRTQGADGFYYDAEQMRRYENSDSKPVTELRVGDVIVGGPEGTSGPWSTPGEVTAIEYGRVNDRGGATLEISLRGTVVMVTPRGSVIDKTWKQRYGYSVDGDQAGYLAPPTVRVLRDGAPAETRGGTASPGYRESNDPKELSARVKGFTVTGVGKDAEGHPYLSLKKGKTVRTAYVQRDPEGNGPGFLFGLPIPDSPRINALRERSRQERLGGGGGDASRELQDAWDEEYYGFLIGKTIEGVGETDDGEFQWTSLRVNVPEAGGVIDLEISRDEEGNGPGWLLVDDGEYAEVAGDLESSAAAAKAMAEWPTPEPIEGSLYPARGQMTRYNTVEARELKDVPVGSVIRWTDFGHGPYDEDGNPILDKGAKPRQVKEGYIERFVEYNDPPEAGGPTRLAKVVTEPDVRTESVDVESLWPPITERLEDPERQTDLVPTIVDVLIDADRVDAAGEAETDLEAEQAEKSAEAALRRLTSKSVADFVMGLPDAADAHIYRARPPYNYYFIVTPDQNASGTATAITPRGRRLDVGDQDAHVYALINTTANDPEFQKGKNRTLDVLDGPLSGKFTRIGQVRHLASRSGGTASPAPVSPGGANRTLVQLRRNRRSMIDARRAPRMATISSVLAGTRSVDAASSPARSAKGNIRNLKAMKDEKITNLADRMVEIGRGADPEASSAIAQQLAERGIDHPIVGPLAVPDEGNRQGTPGDVAAILRRTSNITDDEARPTGAFPEVAEGIDSLGYSWRPGDSLDADLDLASVVDALDYKAEALRDLADRQSTAADVAVDRRSFELAADQRKGTLAYAKKLESHPIRKYSIPEDEGTASVAALRPLYLDGEAVSIADPGSPGAGKTGEIIATRTEQDGRLPLFFHTVRTADGDYEVFENALIGQDEGTASPVARNREMGVVDEGLVYDSNGVRFKYDVVPVGEGVDAVGAGEFPEDVSPVPEALRVVAYPENFRDSVDAIGDRGVGFEFEIPADEDPEAHLDWWVENDFVTATPDVVTLRTTAKTDTIGSRSVAAIDEAVNTFLSESDERTRRDLGPILTAFEAYDISSADLADPSTGRLGGTTFLTEDNGEPVRFTVSRREDGLYDVSSRPSSGSWSDYNARAGTTTFGVHPDDLLPVVGRHTTPLGSASVDFDRSTMTSLSRRAIDGIATPNRGVSVLTSSDGLALVRHPAGAEAEMPLVDAVRVAWALDSAKAALRSDVDRAFVDFSASGDLDGSGLGLLTGTASVTPRVVPDGYLQNTEAVQLEQMPDGALFALVDGSRYVRHRMTAEGADYLIAKPVDETGRVVDVDPAFDEATSPRSHRIGSRILHVKMAPASLGGVSPDYAEQVSVKNSPARSAKGNLRNFRAMGEPKITALAEEMVGSTDTEAVSALADALDDKGLSDLASRVRGSAGSPPTTTDSLYDAIRASVERTPSVEGAADALGSDWQPQDVVNAIQQLADRGVTVNAEQTDADTLAALIRGADLEPTGAAGTASPPTYGRDRYGRSQEPPFESRWDVERREAETDFRDEVVTARSDLGKGLLDADSYDAEIERIKDFYRDMGLDDSVMDGAIREEGAVMGGTASPSPDTPSDAEQADANASIAAQFKRDVAAALERGRNKWSWGDDDTNDMPGDLATLRRHVRNFDSLGTAVERDPDMAYGTYKSYTADEMVAILDGLEMGADEEGGDDRAYDLRQDILIDLEVVDPYDPEGPTGMADDEWQDAGTASPGFDMAGNPAGEPSLDQPEGPREVTSDQDILDAIGPNFEAEWNQADWDLLRRVVGDDIDEMGGEGADYASTTYSPAEMLTILKALRRAWDDQTTGADEAQALYRDILTTIGLYDPNRS